MKPTIYYLSKFMSIFNSECPIYKKSCGGGYESADGYGQLLCSETRGWFSDGSRCQHLTKRKAQKQTLISKLAEKGMKACMHVGGLEE